MKKWTQNPIVVAVLVLLAVLIMVVNVVLPAMRTDNAYDEIPIETTTEMKVDTELENYELNSNLTTAEARDRVQLNPLAPVVANGSNWIARIQWSRRANRNPFTSDDRKGTKPTWLAQDSAKRELALAKLLQQQSRSSQWTQSTEASGNRSNAGAKSRNSGKLKAVVKGRGLEAVALGPNERLALIDGVVVTEGSAISGGVVVSILRDTVWVKEDSVNSSALIFKAPDRGNLKGGVQ